MRILITGIDGFVGRHVAQIASTRGHDVIGISRNTFQNIEGINLYKYYSVDLTEEWPVEVNFDAVLHLAGLASVGDSFTNPVKYLTDNSAMIVQLCEQLLRQSLKTSPRIVVVSTGAIYAPSTEPISEDSRIEMSSPYVISKYSAENFAEYYRGRGLDVVVVRPFNHIGPGQGPGFLVPDLYHKISQFGAQAIETGNLETKRDYTDVRDVAVAYIMLLEAKHLKHNLYNVASNKSYSGLEVLGSLCQALDIEFPIVMQNTDIRPIDFSSVTGDASRLRAEIEWMPVIGFDDSVKDFVDSRQV